jgi:pimeloyl-ACP methyl ester carboxylesterase
MRLASVPAFKLLISGASVFPTLALMNVSAELFVAVSNGVSLCYQTFGHPRDPAVILISGAGASMLDYRPDLIALLNPPDDPHYVIRFDNRDTGRSTAFPVPEDGSTAYGLMDMVADIIGLIDHLGVPVHLVGASFGGPMAYVIAAQRPELVKSMTLLISSPTGGNPNELDNLPPVKEDAIRLLRALPRPVDPGDKTGWIQYAYTVLTTFAYQPLQSQETEEAWALARVIVDRELESGTLFSTEANHGSAAASRWPRELLKDVKCPVSVVQAEKDQFFDITHGEALARDVGDSEIILLKDVGHELPRRIWGQLVEVMLRTFKRGEKHQCTKNA